MLPGPLDLRKGHTRVPEEVGESVEALAPSMAATKPASQRREDDLILGIDRIERAMHSGDVEESNGRAVHCARSYGAAPVRPHDFDRTSRKAFKKARRGPRLLAATFPAARVMFAERTASTHPPVGSFT